MTPPEITSKSEFLAVRAEKRQPLIAAIPGVGPAELAALLLLRSAGQNPDAAAIKKFLSVVDIEANDDGLGKLLGETAEFDFDAKTEEGRKELKLFESIGGGAASGGAASAAGGAAPAAADEPEEEEEEESSAAAGGMFGGSGSGSDSDSDDSS